MKNFNLFFLLIVILFSCKQPPKIYTSEINFETMGTFGTVKFITDSIVDEAKIAKEIDSILLLVNLEFSTYIDTSTISKFNKIDSGQIKIETNHFIELLTQAEEYMKNTQFAFNAKVLPLINYYGFAYEPGTKQIDSTKVDSIKSYINDYFISDIEVYPDLNEIYKYKPMQLDFSAFAKGYGVDVVAYYLDSLGIHNYMVDIGGDVNCKGKNKTGNFWRLGIEEPNENERNIFEVVELPNKAMATSGNYRNFKVLDDGQKIVHIINPRTGYPEISNLLSASIIANNCMDADAYATACMVMGVDTCFNFVLNHPELECYLIYSNKNGELKTKFTEGFGNYLIK